MGSAVRCDFNVKRGRGAIGCSLTKFLVMSEGVCPCFALPGTPPKWRPRKGGGRKQCCRLCMGG